MKFPYRLVIDGRDVASLRVADRYRARLRGLLGTRHCPGALLLSPAASVHGFGMAYALDVALLDESMTVRHLKRLRPMGLVLPRRGIRHVLEAEAGAFIGWGVRPGCRLIVRPDAGDGGSKDGEP